jgi:hypothetical protein
MAFCKGAVNVLSGLIVILSLSYVNVLSLSVNDFSPDLSAKFSVVGVGFGEVK